MRYNFRALPRAEKSNLLRRLSKPVLAVVRWQVAATAAMALAAGIAAGEHAAAFVASRGDVKSAGVVLVGALRAEAVKIGLALLLLWLVLTNYDEAVVAVLIGSFVVTIVIFSMAFFVREY